MWVVVVVVVDDPKPFPLKPPPFFHGNQLINCGVQRRYLATFWPPECVVVRAPDRHTVMGMTNWFILKCVNFISRNVN